MSDKKKTLKFCDRTMFVSLFNIPKTLKKDIRKNRIMKYKHLFEISSIFIQKMKYFSGSHKMFFLLTKKEI